MNLIEVVKKYQGKILDDSILVEYDLFFDNILGKYCKFAIDEYQELEELNNVLSKIKESDKNAVIYVCTYGIDFTDNEIHIYGDTLWINTTIGLEKLYGFFENYRRVEPSDIVLLSEDETIDGTITLVFTTKGEVENYKSFIEKRQLSEIKSLYWD